ncbi:xanthine dehydrogenase family protein subunit M [Spongiactinospora sp. TRM90649]|uniref:FAD binding domain-containing protein n=1 Tax=Spongiactinospora sp. TRM90649 TaxID=3031114 RepID=UPI0023F6EA52|nr:xanthine dehydrogenase family protein subunit M [Spongiactinospora sp. TRM90649]MDF5754712.1 xanthine dehydrogenase family protein subunit M [Spongiactinospora sp. TRM90649]
MREFDYVRAAQGREAVGLCEPGAMYLAGGTNLVDLMRLGVAAPDRLVDVSRLPYDRIEEVPSHGGLRIGATVRNSDLAADPVIRQRYPMLARAVLSGASGQVRNMATVGGNLLQRTRCSYFQDISKPCNKREPGTGCPAIDGDHRNLAIFGHSDSCVATHPSDMAVALAAYDALVQVTGPTGDRAVPIPGLHRLPGEDPERDTVLEPGELITTIELPAPPEGRATYRKVRERASFAFALVSIAALLDVDPGGVVRECRIALGSVAHVPWRAGRAEEALIGQVVSDDAFVAAADAELSLARPLPGNAYKATLARRLIVATLRELAP